MAYARRAGMQVSIDLMFAAPGETLELWRQDLAAAIELARQSLTQAGHAQKCNFIRASSFQTTLAERRARVEESRVGLERVVRHAERATERLARIGATRALQQAGAVLEMAVA